MRNKTRLTKIVLVQFNVKLNQPFSKNSKRVETFIRKAKNNNCKIVCFPEDFWFGPFDYYQRSKWNNLATVQKDKILGWISFQARKYRINIITGTIIEEIKSSFLNTCFIFNAKGQLISKYSKRKLVPYGFEGQFIKKGKNKFKIINLGGIKIGIIICRELFYHQICADLRQQGAEIVFCPSFWPKRSSDYQKNKLENQYRVISEMKVVDALCQSRSFENEIYFCFINAAGRLIENSEFDILLGRTQVCSPFYGCIKKLTQNKHGLIIFEYNKKIINDAKKAYKLIKN